jgi:plastocyanin
MIRAARAWPRMSLVATLIVFLTLIPIVVPHSPVAHAQEGQPVEISVVDFAFEPETVTIAAGTTVTWRNDGDRPHTVTADDGSFDSGRLDPGETFSFTFTTAGTFAYQCGFHPEMQGTIDVTEHEGHGTEAATPTGEESSATSPTPDSVSSGDVGPSGNLEPVENSRLAHVHAGTCADLGIVVYSLPDIQTYRLEENGSDVGAIELIQGTANVPLIDLFGEPFSVHIHESAQTKQIYIACSDIGAQPPPEWTEADGLVLAATEQNDSGYSGFTTLKPAPDGGTAISVALAASTIALEEAAEQEAPPPSTTYTSPTFGYTIGYGPAWQETENVSSGATDRFVLSNGTSFITFTGETAFNGDPQACVDTFVEDLLSDPKVSDRRLAVDENGQPQEGSTAATGAFAIYDHDYEIGGQAVPYTLYVGCVPLVDGEAVLAIVQNVPTADYEEQLALREALLRGLTLAQ